MLISQNLIKQEKQAMLLMITNGQKQHFICVKNLHSLLKASNHCSEHYCLICLKPFRTKSRLKNIIIKKFVIHSHNHCLNLFHSHQQNFWFLFSLACILHK